jgi:hypothetical protein
MTTNWEAPLCLPWLPQGLSAKGSHVPTRGTSQEGKLPPTCRKPVAAHKKTYIFNSLWPPTLTGQLPILLTKL